MFDYTVIDHGRTRYNEMLREAELERRAARLRHQRSGGSVVNHLLLHVSDWLIESGSWLKQRNQMHPGLS
ncbi:MAG TPA: hypothetical protein P5121_26975 [Caldilineaceae bacterium]|nr:hypothetical protein [Caldilineaceae bacterium]